MFNIKITLLGQVYEAEGESVEEALKKIDLSWDKIKGKGVVVVSKGDKTFEKAFNHVQLRRLFSKVTRAHWAKNLEFLLG
jgi:hypothetical protein